MSRVKRQLAVAKADVLFDRVAAILEQARGNVVRAVNTNMVLAYWLIGRELVEEVQRGKGRAEYGELVVENLSARLTARFGNGFSTTTLQYFRKFYLAYSMRCSAIPRPLGVDSGAGEEIQYPLGSQYSSGFSAQLSWSHYP